MKVLFINTIPNLSYFKNRGLDIEYDVINISLPIFPLVLNSKKDNGSGNVVEFYSPDVSKYLEQNYKDYNYSGIIVGIDYSKYGDKTKYTGGYSHWKRMDNGMFWATVRLDDLNVNNLIVHELHHMIGNIINIVIGDITPKDYMDVTPVNGIMMPYYKNNEPDAPDGNHAYTWNLFKPFINQLNNLKYMKTYKYFSNKEVVKYKLSPLLWEILDKMREEAKVPFIITSGLRTVEQNNLAKGKANSGHLKGLAVDIYCVDNFKRGQLLSGVLKFKNECFIEIAKKHIHIDIDSSIHSLGQVIVEDDD